MNPPMRSFFSGSIPSRQRQTLIWIGILWLAVQAFFLWKNGMVTTGEAGKYIYQAHLYLGTGRPETPNLWLYFLQIGLLALCMRLKLSLVFVMCIQLLSNLIATYCFYRTILYLFKERRVALAGTILLILNYPYQQWNTFLQTESLFYSLTLITSCYIVHIEKLNVKKLLTTILLLMILCITRPTGLLFIPPAFIYLFFVFFRNMSTAKKTALLAFIGIGFLFLLDRALGSGGELDFMLPFREEMIICGVPALAHSLPVLTTVDGNSIYGLAYYIIHNPGQFFRLAGLRTMAFFGLFRSYYSTSHNIYLVVFFSCVHVMALVSIPYWIKDLRYKFYFILSIILLNWLTMIFTCDDWSNRFYLSISPFLIILGMPLLLKFFKNQQMKDGPGVNSPYSRIQRDSR